MALFSNMVVAGRCGGAQVASQLRRRSGVMWVGDDDKRLLTGGKDECAHMRNGSRSRTNSERTTYIVVLKSISLSSGV